MNKPIINVLTVAKFEVITLLRSWFFRIFSILSIGVLVVVDIAMFTDIAPVPWGFRAIPSSIPYMNILFLNLAQAVIAVFLSSDFLKRDRKLDTTEVIYTRPISNIQYVLGKTAGIMLTFLMLNAVVLLVAAVFNIFFAGVRVMPASYLAYPVLISLPTVVFILGLSFLLMVLIRNQAVTFILLLGYIATTVFYLSSKFYNLFDYFAFSVPLMYSDLASFGGFSDIIIQRGIFLCLGAAFILITSRSLKRLPQSAVSNRLSVPASAALIAIAVLLSFMHVAGIRNPEAKRDKILKLNEDQTEMLEFDIEKCYLEAIHSGSKIDVSAGILIRNVSGRPTSYYLLNLNPGLNVRRVESRGKELKFEREMHLLRVYPPSELPAGGADSIMIKYSGRIDEDACYPDVDDEIINKAFRIAVFSVKKRYAFISPDFLLLTPESHWYPQSGAGFRAMSPTSHNVDFTEYRLSFKPEDGLVPVSQGEFSRDGDGRYHSIPDTPLTGLTLIAGPYEERSVSVDSVAYALYTKKGHDYFSRYLDAIADTLPHLIREAKTDFELDLDMSYPYRRLTLVEVPVNFHCYQRFWTLGYETVQPEIVLLPENGVTLDGADFRRRAWFQRRSDQRRNQTTPDSEKQSEMFSEFVSLTLTSDLNSTSFRRGPVSDEILYSVFPCYYYHVNNVESKEWPVLNVALESYLAENLESEASPFIRFVTGLSDEEKANIELAEHSLQEMLSNPGMRDINRYVITLKGKYLFNLLRSKTREEGFSSFIRDYLGENRFSKIEGGEFVDSLSLRFGLDARNYIEEWYTNNKTPGFILDGIETYKFIRDERTGYQLRFRIKNGEAADGLVKITLKKRGGRSGRRPFGPPMRRRGEGEDEATTERYVFLEKNQAKEVGFTLNYEPRSMTINMNIAKNLPVILDQALDEFENNRQPRPFDGERVIEGLPPEDGANTIIVDNEDPGFETVGKKRESLLRRMLPDFGPGDEGEKYVGLRFWQASNSWKATINSKFHGGYIRSAHFTSSGDGDMKAIWKTEIPESGYYDVYCFISNIESPWGRRRRREGSEQPDRGSNHYSIYHDDGVEETTVDLNTAVDGWNFLGSYYFSTGETRIELSNEAKGRYVLADAVKWVKQ